MNFYVMTLFPEMVMSTLATSITGRAMEQGHIHVEAFNIRDYTKDRHKRVDDYPYGGGAGMVMQAEPVVECFRAVQGRIGEAAGGRPLRVVYLTPQGRVFCQGMAEEFAAEEDLVLLCGHYEGIDERALELVATDYVSIGDYVLTGGELPAMILIDAVSRLVPGVLNNKKSAEFESFMDGLLEYPQYTRPEEYQGMRVPEILLSGHHARIEAWRREQSIRRTLSRRPDLLAQAVLTKKEALLLLQLRREQGDGEEEAREIQEESGENPKEAREIQEEAGQEESGENPKEARESQEEAGQEESGENPKETRESQEEAGQPE